MPRIPDSQCIIVDCYNFAAITGSSPSSLSKQENVFLYTWTKDQHPKEANEIACAIYHKFCNTNLESIDNVRLVADGCPPQNKNSIMITMITKWLSIDGPPCVKNSELIFPVAGHSFIPPDHENINYQNDWAIAVCCYCPSKSMTAPQTHPSWLQIPILPTELHALLFAQ
nr:unnamed protein product [Callosobruchus analis]